MVVSCPTVTAKRRSRAAPLPPDERRAALIRAVVPLLGTHGRDVTSRQIAEAAGVAEGTIFRAFADKDSLIDAAIDHVMDMTPFIERVESLSPAPTLDERVDVIVSLLRERFEAVFQVLFAVRHAGAPVGGRPGTGPRRPDPAHSGRLDAAVAAHLTAEPGGLRAGTDAVELARWLRVTTLGSTHPLMSGGHPLPTERIVELVLHGIAGAPATPTPTPPTLSPPHPIEGGGS